MEGQAHRGSGDNVAGDQTKIDREIVMGTGGIYNESVTHIHYARTAILPRHLTTTPFIPDVFQGREEDLAAIRAKLAASNQPLLLVNGQGGIGKTSLEDYRLKQELHAAVPSHLDFTNGLAITLIKLGLHYEQQGNLPLALNHYRQAQLLLAELVAKSPLHVEFKNNLDWVNERINELST